MQTCTTYLTSGSTVSPTFHISYNRGETYCDITQKPLHSRRKRFVLMVSAFLVVQLLASIGLVVGVAIILNADNSTSGRRQEGRKCDVWCADECSRLTGGSMTFRAILSRGNATVTRCCVKKRDFLSKIYERSEQVEFETRDMKAKQFDGIRVIDRWTEDDINKWPKSSRTSIRYSKPRRTFSISSDGTYFVHSRIDFNCSNRHSHYNQTVFVRNESHPKVFEDNRVHPSKHQFTIYTSSIDVMVELTKGDELQMLTDPPNCTTPRSIVVYRLRN